MDRLWQVARALGAHWARVRGVRLRLEVVVALVAVAALAGRCSA